MSDSYAYPIQAVRDGRFYIELAIADGKGNQPHRFTLPEARKCVTELQDALKAIEAVNEPKEAA